MPKFKDESQAVELVDAVFSPGPKPPNKADRAGEIHGEATRLKYIQTLSVAAGWAKTTYGCRQLRQIPVDQAQAYLDYRATQVGPRQLNQDRLALEIIPGIGHGTLDKPRSFVGHGEKATEPRAYILDDKLRIIDTLREEHRFSAVLADAQGLRAVELLTIRKLDDLDPARREDRAILDKIDRREWDENRFHGQDGVRYVVVGKGGLPRVRVLSEAHSRELESRKLDQPREVFDRVRVPIMQHYGITGGLKFSRAWTDASHKAVGFSLGAHALRHGYAQDRMEHHLSRGLDYDQADALVAQELGHFDPYSTRTYLRGDAA